MTGRQLAAKARKYKIESHQQLLFAINYVANGCSNITSAYSKAYPDCKKSSATTGGIRLLEDERIQNAVNDMLAEELRKAGVSKENVLDKLVQCLDDTTAKWTERLKAAELLGRHLGMWTENNVQPQVVNIQLDMGGNRALITAAPRAPVTINAPENTD